MKNLFNIWFSPPPPFQLNIICLVLKVFDVKHRVRWDEKQAQSDTRKSAEKRVSIPRPRSELNHLKKSRLLLYVHQFWGSLSDKTIGHENSVRTADSAHNNSAFTDALTGVNNEIRDSRALSTENPHQTISTTTKFWKCWNVHIISKQFSTDVDWTASCLVFGHFTQNLFIYRFFLIFFDFFYFTQFHLPLGSFSALWSSW